MKTIRDFLIEAVINGNNSFDIDKDKLITQDVMKAMQLYADFKSAKRRENYDRNVLEDYQNWLIDRYLAEKGVKND